MAREEESVFTKIADARNKDKKGAMLVILKDTKTIERCRDFLVGKGCGANLGVLDERSDANLSQTAIDNRLQSTIGQVREEPCFYKLMSRSSDTAKPLDTGKLIGKTHAVDSILRPGVCVCACACVFACA